MLFTRRRIQNPRPVLLFWEPIVWVETARYLGVTVDKRLTWLEEKPPGGWGCCVLSWTGGATFPSGTVFCCAGSSFVPWWTMRAPCGVSLQEATVGSCRCFKCLRIAIGASWYINNRKLHEDLGLPFYADHIRALTESFDSELADA
jgi:hypothetical protein